MLKKTKSLTYAGLSLIISASAGLGVAKAQISAPTPIERSSLARDPFSSGTLQPEQGALPRTLWNNASIDALAFLLDHAPSRPATPSLGDAMRRTLLSTGPGPAGAPDSLGGRKLVALARLGFGEEARTLASLSNAKRNDPFVGQSLAINDLLEGDAPEACARNARLSEGRDEPFWIKLRVLCYAIAGERDAADLTFGLLRDNGALSEADEAFLSSLATGAAPKTPLAPLNALHLAAVRQLSLPLSPGLLAQADAGVLKSVAYDETQDVQTRLSAGMRAATMGVMSTRSLMGLFQRVDLDVADIGRATDIAKERPDDPLTDAILYQSIRQMNAPEFLRDKASRIASALSLADNFPRAYALSVLYADEIGALEGALISPSEAGRFALARMTIGDADGAARWLFAMLGSGAMSSMEEINAMELIELTNLLAVLDPGAAATVAQNAGVAIQPPFTRSLTSSDAPVEPETMARIVDAAFSAAVDDIPGQAALAALAASNAAPGDDRLAQVVIGQSLRAAGLGELRRRMDFEAALRARFGAGGEVLPIRPKPTDNQETGLTPRLKPDPT